MRERETAWGEGGGRGVITLATLTRRRPDSRSRSTRSTRSTRLRLTYTPTLGLPLHLPPPLLVHPVPSRRPRRTSPPRRAPLRPPASLPFLRLPFLLVVFPVSTSASSTPCAERRGAARRGSSEFTPRSPNPKATNTRKAEHCRKISDAMQVYNLAVVPQ